MTSGLGITLTLLAWWLGTGAVFLAARGGPRKRRWSFAAATGMLGITLTALPYLSRMTDVQGVLLGLLAGFSVWAWVELSFYTGYVTGPTRAVPPSEASLGVRFRHALHACLWHELVIPVLGVVIFLLASPGGNLWALWIYLTFWVLHEVARINVLVGVPHPFAELLPDHLDHLGPYLEPRAAGWPLRTTLLAHVAGAALLFAAAWTASGPAVLGWTALCALMALGWVEHLVLMLPIPLDRLWRSVGMGKARTAPQAGPAPEAVPLR